MGYALVSAVETWGLICVVILRFDGAGVDSTGAVVAVGVGVDAEGVVDTVEVCAGESVLVAIDAMTLSTALFPPTPPPPPPPPPAEAPPSRASRFARRSLNDMGER